MAKFVYRLQNVLDVKYRLESLEKTAYAQRQQGWLKRNRSFRNFLQGRIHTVQSLRKHPMVCLILSIYSTSVIQWKL